MKKKNRRLSIADCEGDSNFCLHYLTEWDPLYAWTYLRTYIGSRSSIITIVSIISGPVPIGIPRYIIMGYTEHNPLLRLGPIAAEPTEVAGRALGLTANTLALK